MHIAWREMEMVWDRARVWEGENKKKEKCLEQMAQLQSEAVCSGKLANWQTEREREHSFSKHFENVESGRRAHILQSHSVRFTFR